MADTVDGSGAIQLSSESKASLQQSVYTMLADASPSTPPAGKPSLSPPPPDTPQDTSAPGSVSSDKADQQDSTLAKPSTTGSALHANARAFVPNANAPAFVPGAIMKASSTSAHVTHGNGYNGFANGYVANGHSPSAHSASSPHAAWDEAAYSEANYHDSWSGGYNGYGGYGGAYSGYGYGEMTADGLFIPQQVSISKSHIHKT